MKNINVFINEAVSTKIKFQNQEFEMDHIIGNNINKNVDDARTVKSITDDMWNTLKKQGVKYLLTIPPHYYAGDAKNDVFIIKMFIKSKKLYNMYLHTEAYALYDIKTHECINKDIMEKGRAYKIIRLE